MRIWRHGQGGVRSWETQVGPSSSPSYLFPYERTVQMSQGTSELLSALRTNPPERPNNIIISATALPKNWQRERKNKATEPSLRTSFNKCIQGSHCRIFLSPDTLLFISSAATHARIGFCPFWVPSFEQISETPFRFPFLLQLMAFIYLWSNIQV